MYSILMNDFDLIPNLKQTRFNYQNWELSGVEENVEKILFDIHTHQIFVLEQILL